jgi:hypothetical protein
VSAPTLATDQEHWPYHALPVAVGFCQLGRLVDYPEVAQRRCRKHLASSAQAVDRPRQRLAGPASVIKPYR